MDVEVKHFLWNEAVTMDKLAWKQKTQVPYIYSSLSIKLLK